MNRVISNLRRFTRGSGNLEQKVMDLSLSDGVLWSIYSAITSSYLVPITLFILGSRDPVGIIVGIPLMIVPIAQLFAYKSSRLKIDLKRITLRITALDRFLWVPLIILLFVRTIFIYDVLFIILILSVRTFFASFSGTTWTLWVPFFISEERRNEYFSLRNFYMKISSLIGLIIGAGIFLIKFEEKFQYAVLLLIAISFSFASLSIMRNIPSSFTEERPSKFEKSKDYSFITFLSGVSLFTISSSALITYFQFFLVSKNYLSVNLSLYSAIVVLTYISFISTQIFWGKLANLIGNSRSILIGGLLLVTIPLFLVLLHNVISAAIVSILLGTVQSNFSLNIFNEMLKKAVKDKARSVSLFNTVQSLAQGVGPIIGNILLLILSNNLYLLFRGLLILSIFAFLVFVIYTLQY